MGLKQLGCSDLPKKVVNWKNIAYRSKVPIPFDMANLMFVCAWQCPAQVVHGDYTIALAILKDHLSQYASERLNLFYVLDGQTNEYKANEDVRRRQARESALSKISEAIDNGEIPDAGLYRACLSNTSRYIGLVAHLLKHMGLPFIIAPKEADGNLAAASVDGAVVSRDGDMLALGALRRISPERGGGWRNGIAIETSLSDTNEFDEDNPGLSAVYQKHGCLGLIYFGAATGCDFTPLESGIPGLGVKSACSLLMDLPSPLTPVSFALGIVANLGSFSNMRREFRDEITIGGTDFLVDGYIKPVIDAFDSVTFYDESYNVVSLKTREIVETVSDSTRSHATGELDPKTGLDFEIADREVIRAFDFAAIGKSMVHSLPAFVESCRIPDDFETWDNTKLRAVIAARGGTVTHKKPELLAIVRAMKKLEDEYEPMVIDPSAGCYLPSMSFKTTLSPFTEIRKLLDSNEIANDRRNHWVKYILTKAFECYEKGIVMEDMEEISEKSAYMESDFVRQYYTSVGYHEQGNDKKCLKDSYSKHMEQISDVNGPTRYHGYAVISETLHLLLTTQSASFGKDESTRRKKERGQKPDAKQYLSILLLEVEPTSQENGDLHGFGKVVRVVGAWCACKSGQGKCVHDGMALRDQIRLWGSDCPDESISTAGPNKWKHRGADKLRRFDPMRPIRELGFERFTEGKTKGYRSCRESSELRYSVLGASDQQLFDKKCNPSILYPVYDAMQKATNRPSRAAAVYRGLPQDLDSGLTDVRDQVDLWGSKTQIAEWRSKQK